ncbi:hypothetical protein BS78_03G071100 [Paspalum vaginatum]|nr:hypothetical protein BS78_03G071100 [Paspalum vaginatum]KAJ1282703.1 hypothetical protein BS78_03G071100 [Paspalum vaginatum]
MEPVPPATAAGMGGLGTGPGPGYPESTESSPRSRGGDSWDEPFPSSAAAAAAAAGGGGGRLRLMCSFGGRIVPRPTDKSLCYLGGETRIVAVDRHASLADVHARLSRSLLGGQPFTLKYQLPNEDLDALISVSTDEDLDNLVDEYDRIAAGSSSGGGGGSSRTSRIRLFLFPAKPESSSSLGSLLDDSSKSENWFVDALNSAISGSLDGIPRGISADSASVNCLLGLEDDSSVHSRSGVPNSAPAEDQRATQPKLPAAAAAAAVAAGRHPHDVQSVPDSPMLDKNSSFGSTSSAPSLSNLPPIRVRQEERQPPPVAVEDHFAQMGINEQQLPPAVAYMQPPPQQVPIPAMPGTEASTRVYSDDDNKSDHGGGGRKPQPAKQDLPPVADPTNRAVYYNDRSPPAELKRDMPVGTEAASYRLPVSAPDAAAAAAAAANATQPPPGYVFAQMPPQPQQPPPPQQPQQPQQPAPQQFVTAGNQHFIHNPATGTFIPIQSYYHHPVPQQAPPQPVPRPQQAPAYDPNTGMYYIPVQQNAPQPYSMPPGAQVTLPPPTLVDTTPKPTVPIPQMAVKPELQQPGVYRTTAAAAPAPNAAPGYAGMGYHHVIQSHHHPAQQPVANMPGNFGYEYADPTRPQIYYSQAAAPPTLAPQYQPIVSPDAGQAEKH